MKNATKGNDIKIGNRTFTGIQKDYTSVMPSGREIEHSPKPKTITVNQYIAIRNATRGWKADVDKPAVMKLSSAQASQIIGILKSTPTQYSARTIALAKKVAASVQGFND